MVTVLKTQFALNEQAGYGFSNNPPTRASQVPGRPADLKGKICTVSPKNVKTLFQFIQGKIVSYPNFLCVK